MKIISILSLSVLLMCSTGCQTTDPLAERDIRPIIKTAAYVGTHYSLQKHPEWRQGFELAVDQLRTLETSETVDFATILAIVNRLPVDALRGDDAAIVMTGATILLSEYGGSILPLHQVEKARPIAAALREGIELGLGR